MTGANSHLPILVYQNLSSVNLPNGMIESAGPIDVTRTIQTNISFASLASSLSSSNETTHTQTTYSDTVKEQVEENTFYSEEEEGEDLTFFWEALHHCQQLYEQIKAETSSFNNTRASLLDQLTIDDLLEWLYDDVSHQFREYIDYQE
jgi:hypothetical protein